MKLIKNEMCKTNWIHGDLNLLNIILFKNNQKGFLYSLKYLTNNFFRFFKSDKAFKIKSLKACEVKEVFRKKGKKCLENIFNYYKSNLLPTFFFQKMKSRYYFFSIYILGLLGLKKRPAIKKKKVESLFFSNPYIKSKKIFIGRFLKKIYFLKISSLTISIYFLTITHFLINENNIPLTFKFAKKYLENLKKFPNSKNFFRFSQNIYIDAWKRMKKNNFTVASSKQNFLEKKSNKKKGSRKIDLFFHLSGFNFLDNKNEKQLLLVFLNSSRFLTNFQIIFLFSGIFFSFFSHILIRKFNEGHIGKKFNYIIKQFFKKKFKKKVHLSILCKFKKKQIISRNFPFNLTLLNYLFLPKFFFENQTVFSSITKTLMEKTFFKVYLEKAMDGIFFFFQKNNLPFFSNSYFKIILFSNFCYNIDFIKKLAGLYLYDSLFIFLIASTEKFEFFFRKKFLCLKKKFANKMKKNLFPEYEGKKLFKSVFCKIKKSKKYRDYGNYFLPKSVDIFMTPLFFFFIAKKKHEKIDFYLFSFFVYNRLLEKIKKLKKKLYRKILPDFPKLRLDYICGFKKKTLLILYNFFIISKKIFFKKKMYIISSFRKENFSKNFVYLKKKLSRFQFFCFDFSKKDIRNNIVFVLKNFWSREGNVLNVIKKYEFFFFFEQWKKVKYKFLLSFSFFISKFFFFKKFFFILFFLSLSRKKFIEKKKTYREKCDAKEKKREKIERFQKSCLKFFF